MLSLYFYADILFLGLLFRELPNEMIDDYLR